MSSLLSFMIFLMMPKGGKYTTNLENCEYKSSEIWRDDITQVWKNALDYHGEHSAIGIMAKYMYDVFIDLADSKVPEDEEQWVFQIINHTLKLRKLKNVSGQNFSTVHPITDDIINDERKKLTIALRKLNSKEDIAQITRILMLLDQNPQIDIKYKECLVDLSAIPRETLYLMILYVKRRFKELNMSYP